MMKFWATICFFLEHLVENDSFFTRLSVFPTHWTCHAVYNIYIGYYRLAWRLAQLAACLTMVGLLIFCPKTNLWGIFSPPYQRNSNWIGLFLIQICTNLLFPTQTCLLLGYWIIFQLPIVIYTTCFMRRACELRPSKCC